MLPTPVLLGFPGGSAGKESACNVRDVGLIPGLGRSPGKGTGYPLPYSGLENSMDCSSWLSKNQTQLSDFHFHFHSRKQEQVIITIQGQVQFPQDHLPLAHLSSLDPKLGSREDTPRSSVCSMVPPGNG